ncbi:MAG: hypothetical protein OEM15_14440 [Myxococcales bacterium]|nr:hypothetical protein [Myxococcales bacterium]MDH3483215.1 hypothetical protein [Myxococcales bacterium]
MTTRRMIWMTCLVAGIAVLSAPKSTLAHGASEGEAPRLFADISSSTRLYPNADAALTGFALGAFYRPFEKCIHFAGEAFARFGRKDGTPDDLKMRTAGGAIGALWGTGDWNRWFGAGAMFDLGWGRVGPQNEFVSSAYLRALLYWRLRKEFWLGLDVRTGYVIAPVTVGGVGIKGPVLGLGIGVSWGKDEEDYAPEPEAAL